jgi:hypothetical protein
MIQPDKAVNIYSHDGSVQFFKASDTTLPGTAMCIASGFVPPPFNGIEQDEELLSDLVAIGCDASLDLIRAMTMKVWKAAEKGKYAVVHMWDDAASRWKPIPTYDDGSVRSVAAVFQGAGTYAVFSRTAPVTSVEGVSDPRVHITPNPADGDVVVSGLAGAGSVAIMDLSGTTITEHALHGEESFRFSASSVMSGLYFVRITWGSTSTMHTLIIRH